MIETTVPEINVAELMERVRVEALRPTSVSRRAGSAKDGAVALPPVASLPPAPGVWIPGAIKFQKERLDDLVQTAREKNEPNSRIPKFLRRFFRKQGGYNRAVAESVATLAKTTDELARRVGEITVCLGQFNNWLLALHEQSDADAAWMKSAAPAISNIRRFTGDLALDVAELRSAHESMEAVWKEREAVSEARFGALESERESLAKQLGTLGKKLEETSREASGARTAAEDATKPVRQLTGEIEHLGIHIRNLQGFVEKHTAEANAVHRDLERKVNDYAGLESRMSAFEEQAASEAVFVKGELSEYGSLLRRLFAERAKSPAGRGKKLPGVKSENVEGAGFDSFYLSFENRFRGPRDEIKKRVAFYLPFVHQAQGGAADRPVLDLGCGRGEWLELLEENKLAGQGVDLNDAMVSQCTARGLKARRADALAYLRSLRANSHGAITGFHIIEHLPFEVLMELFSQARRVLKPGGIAIFESPNCKNLVVGACNFHIDPTHRSPVFPETAEFMLASHGFEKIGIEYLSPVSDVTFDAKTNEMVAIKDLLFGPQDFGIIAYKPKGR